MDARTGRPRLVREVDPGEETTRDLDPVAGDLAFVKDGEFLRIRAEDGTTDRP